MDEGVPKKNRRSDWIFKAGGFALIMIIAYYLIVEHTAHLIEYGGLFAFFLIILFLVIVRFGVMNWGISEKPPEG